MFNNRRKSQKPDTEFISRFRQAFSDIVPRRDSQSSCNMRVGEPLIALSMAENNDVKIEDHDVKLPITNNDRTP
ncbi:hypothetical protein N7497_012251 [Penicillium chrysogenum]|nr:hypothetical protein N7497_012251 [Penicillium chrysogenum]